MAQSPDDAWDKINKREHKRQQQLVDQICLTMLRSSIPHTRKEAIMALRDLKKEIAENEDSGRK